MNRDLTTSIGELAKVEMKPASNAVVYMVVVTVIGDNTRDIESDRYVTANQGAQTIGSDQSEATCIQYDWLPSSVWYTRTKCNFRLSSPRPIAPAHPCCPFRKNKDLICTRRNKNKKLKFMSRNLC